MSLSFELFEGWSPAHQCPRLVIEVAGNLSGQITICEAYAQLLRLHEAGSDDLDESVTLRWTTFGKDLVDADRSVEK